MLAFIGGSGFNTFEGFQTERIALQQTPYASEPVAVTIGHLPHVSQSLCFLPRHGDGHTMPPHRINYRANLYALYQLQVSGIIAVNAVGGIHKQAGPGQLMVPDQIVDYTYGREHTFFDGSVIDLDSPDRFTASVAHIDFTEPYDQELRRRLSAAAARLDIALLDHGVYGATQGPRLETPAEVRRLQRDGCDIIGMTGMPEAALARELNLPYACIALSVNWAAGLSAEPITMDAIRAVLTQGMDDIRRILSDVASHS